MGEAAEMTAESSYQTYSETYREALAALQRDEALALQEGLPKTLATRQWSRVAVRSAINTYSRRPKRRRGRLRRRR